MPESLPTYATLTTRNLIVDDGAIIISVKSQQSLFPKENLYSPLRSRKCRSTSATTSWVILGQFATPTLPTIVALIDSNISSAANPVEWELADDQAMTTNKQTWYLQPYAQDWTPKTRTGRHVLRWYPGTPNLGGSAAARSFFRVTIPANSTMDSNGDGVADSYVDLGVLFVGNYLTLPVNLGLDQEYDDPSGGSESDGGASFPDRRPTYARLSPEAPLLDDAASLAMARAFEDAGTTRHVLLDKWGGATDATKKADSCIYGHLGSKLGGSVGTFTRYVQMFDRLKHEFREARA